jgi:cytochrome oxidase Cu insertion factor (SCO1/SenC/PrrC family)
MRFSLGLLGLLAGATVGAMAQAPAVPEDPGVKVGAKVPAFQLPDQNGKTQTLASLRGPKGLMLVFFRSADW